VQLSACGVSTFATITASQSGGLTALNTPRLN